MSTPLSYYVAAGAIYGGATVIIVQSMWGVAKGLWRRSRRKKSVDVYTRRSAIEWDSSRLRFRRSTMGFSYADLKGDKPYVAPAPRLTAAQATAKRNEVLDQVVEDNGDWMAGAITAFEEIPDGSVVTGEDIRIRLVDGGLPPPRHPNVWGSLIGTLTKRERIIATGEWRPMRAPGSNGRKTPVYVKGTPGRPALRVVGAE